jgi:hypothetical protein
MPRSAGWLSVRCAATFAIPTSLRVCSLDFEYVPEVGPRQSAPDSRHHHNRCRINWCTGCVLVICQEPSGKAGGIKIGSEQHAWQVVAQF